MVNQIYRNGILPKKPLDGDGFTRIQGLKIYHGEYVIPKSAYTYSDMPSDCSDTPDGNVIIHKDDSDPNTGNCIFIHPPHGSEVEYRAENGMNYSISLNLAELATSASGCIFCSILYRGVHSQREFWILRWAMSQWMSTHTLEDLQACDSEMPWIQTFADEVVHSKKIDEKEILLQISFPKGCPYVGVHLMVAAHPMATNTRRRPLLDIEFYTVPGSFEFSLCS